MRKYYILIIFFLLCAIINAQDIQLKIPKTSINQVASAFITSKYLSYGAVDEGAFVQYYSLKPYNLTVNLESGNQFSITMNSNFVANINLGLFDFDIRYDNVSITLNGQIQLVNTTDGYKIIFDPQSFTAGGAGIITSVLNAYSSGIISRLPEIFVNINQPLLPNIVGQYFTTSVPVLTTNSNEVILSLTLSAGPRYISAYNDINENMNIGFVEHEEGTSYVPYASPKTFEWSTGTVHKIQTQDDILSQLSDKYKYSKWFKKETIQPEIAPRRIQLTVGTSDDQYSASFQLAKRIQLTNQLEGTLAGGNVTYDATTSTSIDQYDYYHPSITHQLNTSVPNGTLGRNWVFQNWSDGNTIQSRNIILNNDVNLTAKYKGQGISNQQNAYTSNSQRKSVRAQNGNLFNIYESIGKIWLEKSSNDGGNWVIMNNNKPVDNDFAEFPSIDYIPWSGINSWIGGVYYQSSSSSLEVIFVRSNDPNIPSRYSIGANFDYTNNLAPVIAITGNRVLVVSPGWYGENYEGLVYFYGEINLVNNYVVIDWYEEQELIPNTNYTSKNISIAADKTTSNVFHITWNEGNSIKYCKATGSGNNLTFSTVETPSTSSIYSSNLYPSISLANGNPVISWTGGGKLVADKIAAKETAINESTAIVRRKGTSWGDFQITGNSVNYTNNNSANTTSEKTVIVWSEGNPPSSKWLTRTGTTYSSPASLSHSGLQTQVIAGNDYNAMTSMVFNSSQLPYYFTKTTTDFSGGPQEEMGKISNLLDSVITYGRTGIINAGGADFVFNTGDILVGDEIIEFIDKADTTIYSSDAELNVYTRTKNFTLENNSSFYLSNIYYVLNKDSVGELLGENDNVNFKVELVRVAGEQVVGVFDDIDYNRNSLDKYANIFYEVDCSGIQPGEYYLRLVTTVEGMALSGEVNYTLANLMNESSGLEKRQMTKVGFTGTEKPVTYELFQNYPNPFNPVTTITYQIPKEGLVTLKIYDILGKEVTTLINEEKQAGKYSIEFNAAKLSSGVYLYELRSNEYKSTKKLLLMK